MAWAPQVPATRSLIALRCAPNWSFGGAGDGNRTRTISLGTRPVGASDRPDLGIRCTASDRQGPLDTRANGPLMAHSLMVSAVVRSQRAEFQGRPCSLVPIVDVTAASTLSSGGWPAAPGETATPATRMPAGLAWLITWLLVRITRAARGSSVSTMQAAHTPDGEQAAPMDGRAEAGSSGLQH